MIVITPGHEETRRIFDDCVHSEATYNQYALYNRYGYYSTELYELSQAGPVFDIGDAESDGYASSAALTGRVNIRRYLNYLIEIQEMVSSIDYETGGRPRVLYLLKR